MSQSSFPNITPLISINIGQAAPLLLAIIALEELELADMINTAAEKIQSVLGTLSTTSSPSVVTISDLLAINEEARKILQEAIKREMILQFKLEKILNLIGISP